MWGREVRGSDGISCLKGRVKEGWEHLWWEVDKWLFVCLTAEAMEVLHVDVHKWKCRKLFKILKKINLLVSRMAVNSPSLEQCSDASYCRQLTWCPIHVRDSWSLRVNCYNRIQSLTHTEPADWASYSVHHTWSTTVNWFFLAVFNHIE